MSMDIQTRQDLERLRGVVEQRWRAGFCLLLCMNQMHREDGFVRTENEYFRRNDDMISALDFSGPYQMYTWNDQPHRIRQHVLNRIDNTLAKAW